MIAAAVFIGLAIILLLLVVGELVGALAPRQPPSEDELQTALELHAIRRRLDVADLKHRARVDAARLRRELDDELGPRMQDEDWR